MKKFKVGDVVRINSSVGKGRSKWFSSMEGFVFRVIDARNNSEFVSLEPLIIPKWGINLLDGVPHSGWLFHAQELDHFSDYPQQATSSLAPEPPHITENEISEIAYAWSRRIDRKLVNRFKWSFRVNLITITIIICSLIVALSIPGDIMVGDVCLSCWGKG